MLVEGNSAERGSLFFVLGREPGSMPPVLEAADHLLHHLRLLADRCSIWMEENLTVKLPSLLLTLPFF